MSKLGNWARLADYPRGELGRARVSEKTRAGYLRVINHFVEWLSTDGWDYPQSARELDRLGERYVEFSFSAERPKSWVCHLPAALVLFYPSLRGELPFTQAALSGWRKLCPGGSWATLPLDLAVAAAAVLHHLGHAEASTALILRS